MPETYRVVVDSDLDGFVHLWSDPAAYTSDNLIADRRLELGTLSGGAAVVQARYDRYGNERWFVNVPTGGSYVQINSGYTPTATTSLRVTAWMEHLAGTFNMGVYSGGTFKGSVASLTTSAGVQLVSTTFTADAGQEVIFRFSSGAGASGGYAQGFMLTLASSGAPTEFWVNDPADDIITDDVVSVEWSRGFDGVAQPVAVVGTGEMVLTGWDTYMPGWAPSSPIVIGAPLVVARQNGSDWDIINRMEVNAIDNQKGDRHADRVRVRLTDAARLWYEAPYYDALLLDADQHDLLRAIADSIGNPPAPFYERVGYDLASTIDSDSGSTKVSYLTDNVDDGDFIAPILRELGWMTIQRCWITREGLMSGWAYPKMVSKTATISDATDIVDGRWVHAPEMFNYVNLPLQVRSQTSSTTVVDNSGSEFVLRPSFSGEQFEFNVRYRSGNNWQEVIGVTAIDAPSASVNWWVNDAINLGGTDYTGSVNVAWVDRGTVLQVFVTVNTTVSPLYIRLVVDGTALLRGQPFNYVQTDDASIAQYGVRALHRQLPYFDDILDVELAAEWLIGTYGIPRSGYDMIAFDQDKNLSYAWEWDIYTMIGINTDLAASPALPGADYIITGEYQRIDLGSNRHRVEYKLERYFEAS